MKYLVFTLLFVMMWTTRNEAARVTRSRCNRSASIGNVLGAITGASLAAESFGNQCYYQDGPQYDFYYATAPLFAYDYPTYAYSPSYAYQNVRYSIYPSYYFRR